MELGNGATYSYYWIEIYVSHRIYTFIIQEVTVGLLKAAMLDHSKSAVGYMYLIDGFPRELEKGGLFKQQVLLLVKLLTLYYLPLVSKFTREGENIPTILGNYNKHTNN